MKNELMFKNIKAELADYPEEADKLITFIEKDGYDLTGWFINDVVGFPNGDIDIILMPKADDIKKSFSLFYSAKKEEKKWFAAYTDKDGCEHDAGSIHNAIDLFEADWIFDEPKAMRFEDVHGEEEINLFFDRQMRTFADQEFNDRTHNLSLAACGLYVTMLGYCNLSLEEEFTADAIRRCCEGDSDREFCTALSELEEKGFVSLVEKEKKLYKIKFMDIVLSSPLFGGV